jgi:hypothetical protein
MGEIDVAERAASGKAARACVPRSSHAGRQPVHEGRVAAERGV